MEEAFDPATFQINPNFADLTAALQALPSNSILIQDLETFAANTGYKIVLGAPGGGTYSDYSNHQITIDSNLLPVGPNNSPAATTQDIQTIEDELTHELTHMVGEPANVLGAGGDTTPAQAVSDSLEGEGIAYTQEYIGDRQVGIPFPDFPNTNNQDLKTILDNIATQDGSFTSAQFVSDATTAAENWTATAQPSNTATGLLYSEYYKDGWGISQLGGNPSAINWQQITSGQISVSTNADNSVTITEGSPLALTGGGALTIYGTVDSNGNIITATTVTKDAAGNQIGTGSVTPQPDGAPQMTLSGVNPDVGDYDAIVQIAPGSTTSFEGDGNTIGVSAGSGAVSFSLLGSSNSLTVNDGGYAAVQGANNTLTLNTNGTAVVAGISNTVNFVSGDAITLGDSLNEVLNGSGGTLVLNGPQDSSATVTGDDNNITEAATDLLYVDGNSNTIAMGSGTATADITGTGETITGDDQLITLEDNSSASVSGSGNTYTLGTGDQLTLNSDSTDTVTGNSDTLIGASGDSITANGSSNTLSEAGESAAVINGSSDQLTIGTSGSTATLSGSGESMTATGDTVNLTADSSGSLTGNNDTVVLGAGVALTIAGTGASVSATSDYLTLGNNSSAVVTGSENTYTLGTGDQVGLSSGSTNTLTGNSDSVAGAANDTTTVNGSDNTVTESSGSSFTLNGSDDQLSISGSGSNVSLTGSDESVTASTSTVAFGANSSGSISGSDDTLTTGTGASISLSGTGHSLTGSSSYIELDSGATAQIGGASDVITCDGSNGLTVCGNSNSVTLDGASTATVNGTQEQITAASQSITFGDDSSGVLSGGYNSVDLGACDKILVDGTYSTVNVQNGDIVYLASNEAVTISGSGATIVGNSGDIVSVTGTNDSIYGDSSYIKVNGTSTGDVVYGSGNSGTGWGGYEAQSGAYGGYSGGGYSSGGGDMVMSRRAVFSVPAVSIAASQSQPPAFATLSISGKGLTAEASTPQSFSLMANRGVDQLIQALAAAPASARAAITAGTTDSTWQHAIELVPPHLVGGLQHHA